MDNIVEKIFFKSVPYTIATLISNKLNNIRVPSKSISMTFDKSTNDYIIEFKIRILPSNNINDNGIFETLFSNEAEVVILATKDELNDIFLGKDCYIPNIKKLRIYIRLKDIDSHVISVKLKL